MGIIIALLCGIIIGTFTGIMPGIHTNLIAAIGGSMVFMGKGNEAFAYFLVSLGITHSMISFIPSIFLGAPKEENYLSVLPGHEMLNEGEGYKAVIYSLYGCLLGLLIVVLFSPLFILFLEKSYIYAERIMPIILIISSGFLIGFEKKSRWKAIMIFCLAGILGMISINLGIKESLLALFTGLFGVSSLFTSLEKKELVEQKKYKLKEISISVREIVRSFYSSIIATPLCSFLPGLGGGQATIIGSQMIKDISRKEFLMLTGIVSIGVLGLSIPTFYVINKARTGIAVYVGAAVQLNLGLLMGLILTMLFAGIVAFFITMFFAKKSVNLINKINYRRLSLGVMFFLFLVVLYFAGWKGFLLMLVSACLGLGCIYLGVRRTHLMGCLIVPALVFSLV